MDSIWSESCTLTERDSLNSDCVVDAVVIGAGMAGLLTAFLLQQQGMQVVVLEGKKTASGVTRNTTAKITSQHDLTYDKLIREFGLEKAEQYAWANQNAIQMYRDIIQNRQIECDLEVLPAFVYTMRDQKKIEDEVIAARKLGIKAEYTQKTDLPFQVKAAVRFEEQAQFHPLKFLKNISSDLTIYENTMVHEIRDDLVITNRGRVTAEHIVVATHFPIINIPGWYFARMHQERSYVLALENAGQVHGMYIDEDSAGYSFRNWGEYLLLGGAGHRTGKNPDGKRYDQLRQVAQQMYPQSREAGRWSAQDCVTWDNVPYIGRYSSSIPNLYVATGFRKWGMTTSMVSAQIITDMIFGKKNKCADVFSPQRFNAQASMKNLITDGAHSVAGLTAGAFASPEHRCTHLGCKLQWNPDEGTWDCPCHGSRFSPDGKMLDNPALKGKKDG